MGNTILVWLIGVMFIVFAYVAVAAGWGLITAGGNVAAVTAAKSKFTNAFIGLLIVLAAWLLVDTIMKQLLTNTNTSTPGGDLDVYTGFGVWSEIQCGSMAGTIFVETHFEPTGAMGATHSYVDPVTGSTVTTPAGNSSLAGSGLTDAEVKNLLDNAGIEYKSSVGGDGLKPHVINRLISLDNACACNITVTSLTDGNHASGEFSHGNGFKADIRSVGGGDPNPKLITYVQSLPSAGQWSNGTKLYFDAGACATYALEATHVDIEFRTGC